MTELYETSIRGISSERSGISYGTESGGTTVKPSRIVEKFQSIEGTRFDDKLPELVLPGHGERDEDCGEDFPRFCADCGHVTHVGRTCYRSTCPRCWKGWARRRATSITSKLEALRRYRESAHEGWTGLKFHHLVASPPDGYRMDCDEPLQRTFDVLKEVFDEMGASTGVIFYHPYRAGSDGNDVWKRILPEEAEIAWSDTRDNIRYAPHFHAVVLSNYVPTLGTESIEENSGWVINRVTVGEDSNVSIYDEYDLARVVTYSLSHTGIEGDDRTRAAYRYFGEVANFSADQSVERAMDAAVRSVAVKTLGLPYDSLTCTIDRERVELTTVEAWEQKIRVSALGSGTGAGDGSGIVGQGSTIEQTEHVEEETVQERCKGRLLDITEAPRFVEDEEWLERAEHSEMLLEAWCEWCDEPEGDPE